MLISFCVGYVINDEKDNNSSKIINKQDTTYNHIKLDNIKYNIIKKDSIIYKLKKDIKYEVNKAINANDSDAIIQFYELVGQE